MSTDSVTPDPLDLADHHASEAVRNLGAGLPKYAQVHALVSLAQSVAAIARQLTQQTTIQLGASQISQSLADQLGLAPRPGETFQRPLRPIRVWALPDDLARPRLGNVISLADGGWAYAGQLVLELPRLPHRAIHTPRDPEKEARYLSVSGKVWPCNYTVYGDKGEPAWLLSIASLGAVPLVTAVWTEGQTA